MHKDILKETVYQTLLAVSQDSKFYRYSPVGSDYCHFTEKGSEEVIAVLNLLLPAMRKTAEEELDQRAKDITMRTLKE